VDNVVPAPQQLAGSPQPPRRRPGAGALLTLVNGVLAGVGGVYVSTHSVMITVIAAVVAVVLAAMVLIFQR
jgi:hypothetical protein